MYLTNTICSDYHITTPLSYNQGSILCTLPTQYAPNIIIVVRWHIVYLTYTICSEYHNTTEVAYCVPYLHNMLQLSSYFRGSILCDPTYTICSHYHNTTKVAYCVPYLHNMLPLSRYYRGSIMCTLPTQYAPIIIILPR